MEVALYSDSMRDLAGPSAMFPKRNVRRRYAVAGSGGALSSNLVIGSQDLLRWQFLIHRGFDHDHDHEHEYEHDY